MEKYNLKYVLKHLNKKRIKEDLKTGGKYVLQSLGITLGTTALFAGGTFGILSLSGCGKTEDTKNDTSIESEADNASTNDATTEAVVLEDSSMLNDDVDTIDIADENQAEYDKIDAMEEDIVAFAENSLPNGFIEVNEDNKLDKAKMFTDAYVMMNLSSNNGEINPATVAILNQNNILIPREMKDNFKNFTYQLGDYMQIVEPDTMIDFEILVQQQDDAKFLNELETEIAYMNVATTAEERQERINNIIAIRDSILTDASTTSYSASTLYTAINMIIKADATAKAYGNKIFNDEEARLQLYTTLEYAICHDAEEFGIELDYEYDFNELSSSSSFESMYFTSTGEILEDVIKIYQGEKCDSYYSYEEVTARIAEKLLGLYKAPEMDAVAKENSIRESADKQNTPVGTTTTTEVTPEDVPEEVRKKDTTTTTDYSDNQSTEDADYVKDASESNDVYIQAKGAGYKAGSMAAENAYATNYAGHVEDMQYKSLGTAPTEGCTNYNDVYNYFYNVGWNATLSGYKDSEAAAKTENDQAETTFESYEGTEEQVSETTETITYSTSDTIETDSKTTTTTTSTTTTITNETDTSTLDNGTYYVPVESEEEEEINETIEDVTYDTYGSAISEKISALKALRNQVISMAYNVDVNESVNVKRV